MYKITDTFISTTFSPTTCVKKNPENYSCDGHILFMCSTYGDVVIRSTVRRLMQKTKDYIYDYKKHNLQYLLASKRTVKTVLDTNDSIDEVILQ